nr:recombinase family protein [Micromonospora sp. DSM 115978]
MASDVRRSATGDQDGGDGPLIDLYGRLSYAADGSEINVDEQVSLGSVDIVRRGGRLGKVFRDDSKSAWNPDVVREDWDRLMGRLEAGDSDGVWVLDLTRFSRKVMEGERLVEAARSGRLVWSASGEYDLNTAEGRKVFRKEMVDAAGESDKISERVRRGKRRKASRGRNPHGGGRGFAMPGWEPAPPGWEVGDPRTPVAASVVEAERAVIRECYQRLLAGEAQIAPLAWDLNARGIRTVSGGLWTRNILRRTLVRPALAGLIEVRGEILGRARSGEPVVSEEDWRRLCAVLEARKRGRPAGRRHPLSGLMTCGRCGFRLFAFTRPDGKPYPIRTARRSGSTGAAGKRAIPGAAGTTSTRGRRSGSCGRR